MDTYKKINKDLVLSIQELKIQQSFYQQQIISLKRQLMEELERRVELEKTLKIMMVNNFKNSLKFLDPDCSLLKILQDYGELKIEEGQKNQAQKQPRQILQELRKSNSLHRRSSIVVSPSRRLSYPMIIATPESTDIELEKDSSGDGLDADQNMSLEESFEKSTDQELCIRREVIEEEEEEDIDEEEEEEEQEEASDAVDVEEPGEMEKEEGPEYLEKYMQEDKPSHPNRLIEDTLRSIQNMSVTETCEDMSITEISRNDEDEEDSKSTLPQQSIVKEKQSLDNSSSSHAFINNKCRNGYYIRRSPLQEIGNHKHNNIEKGSSIIQTRYLENVVVKRGKRRSLFEDKSVQSVRHMNTQTMDGRDEFEDDRLSVGFNSYREPSLESCVTSLVLNELTCGQFANAASSTPNSSQIQNSSNSSETLQTALSRSSRRCKPTCLAEPSLRLKIRNEGNTIFPRYKTKKKR